MPQQRHVRNHGLIDTSLSNPAWFRDGEPTWIEGKYKWWERPCQSAAAARQLRCDAVQLLRRHRKNDPAVIQLADRLENCSRRFRCLGGACSECARAHQRWFVSNGNELIHGPLRNTPLVMATIVPDYGQHPMDRLNTLNINAVWLKTARILKQSKVGLAFGGIDVSVNQEGIPQQPYLQVQFTLFIPERQWPKSDGRLRREFNRSGKVDRPVHVQSFDGDNAGLAYALKYQFQRREQYQQTPDDRRDGRSNGNTRNRPLRGPDWARLMVLLERMGLDARICLIGVKRVRNHGEVTMQLIR